ncbi:MAG: hypothetical protein JNG88_08170 [Phycisphaerales bacterium]|nr:hypothetical protein [Phycisphaerales bacterium]
MAARCTSVIVATSLGAIGVALSLVGTFLLAAAGIAFKSRRQRPCPFAVFAFALFLVLVFWISLVQSFAAALVEIGAVRAINEARSKGAVRYIK